MLVFNGDCGSPAESLQRTLEIFGDYIHTYKFSEEVEDEAVLDLVHEACDIDQPAPRITLTSERGSDERIHT